MAARKGTHQKVEIAKGKHGQSLLEFLLMLPMMIGLIAIMSRVNTAIQASIVDQQYARMQTLWLTFNSPVYPKLGLQASQLNQKNYNQMMVGVSDNEITAAASQPVASTTMITRTPALAAGGNNDSQQEPPSRANVRIRNTVTLCTQANLVGGTPILNISVQNGSSNLPTVTVAGAYNLPEDSKFDYCRGMTQGTTQ
jgi:hypothetical protein